MRFVIFFVLVSVCFAAAPPTITDFTATGTITQGGLPQDVELVEDISGLRTYLFIGGLNASTWVYQGAGAAETYRYTLMSSGCTCNKLPSSIVASLFQPLQTATQNNTLQAKASCSGTTWTSSAVGAPGTEAWTFCFNGNTPVSAAKGTGLLYTFKNFTAGKPTSFPDELLSQNLNVCQEACI